MEGEVEVGRRKALEQAILDHGNGALTQFLGRLADQDQRAGPVILVLDQLTGRANEGRHVGIVGAGMHHRVFTTAMVNIRVRGRIGKTRLFRDRKPVHIGAQHEGRALTVLQHRDNAGAADALGHVITQRAQFGGQARGGFVFLVGEFRMSVEMPVETFQIGLVIGGDRRAQGIIARIVLGRGETRTPQRQTHSRRQSEQMPCH